MPSRALTVTAREDLVGLLYEAAELEHGLSCSYLYASFSLKVDHSSFTETQREAVSRWRDVIAGIAAEEMLHLALVSNLLTAIGAQPRLSRPNLPQQSRFYPGGLTISLRRFDDDSMTRFMHLERPVDMDVEGQIQADDDVDLDAEPPTSPPGSLTSDDDRNPPDAESLLTVGQLYEAILDGFVALEERLGAASLFIGPRRAQAHESAFEVPGLTPVFDLGSARAALATLVDQGEGVRGDWEDAHYGRFRRMREELRRLCAEDPDFDPAWPCVDNPIGPDGVSSADHNLITADAATDVLNLFNNAYHLMATMLLRFFSQVDDDRSETALAQASVQVMTTVLAPLGALLASMPADGDSSTTAGASFETHRAVSLVPHGVAAWHVLIERIREVATFADGLGGKDGRGPLERVATSLGAVADELALVAADRAPH